MHPQIEEYIRPKNLDDAVAILRDPNRNAIPVAGAEVGVATPYNEVVTSIIRAKEVRLGLR